MTSSEMSPADIRACTCGNDGNNSSGWGGDWGAWIIVFLIFAAFGWGGNGFVNFGGGNGAAQGALTRADLCSEFNFNNVDSALRGIQNGLCDGFYSQNTNMLTGFAQLQNSANQGFAGLNTALITNGYETRNAINQLGFQQAQCCCDTLSAIKDNTTSGVMNTNALQRQISDCCCDNEKAIMGINYNMATQNCQTLQAIDKLGDRIIDYMSANEKQNLRDENQALRLAASQQAQNNYLIQNLRPSPSPSYLVPNPHCCNNSGYSYGNSYGNCCA